MTDKQDRQQLIERLATAWRYMERWERAALKHSMGAPSHHPETGELFTSFRQVLEAASDETLDILSFDFEDNRFFDRIPVATKGDKP